MIRIRVFALFILTLVLQACTVTSGPIGTNLTLCCPGTYSEYTEYGITTENIPLFLRDYLISEFDAAFQEKGLSRNDQINDVRVELVYNHVNLRSDQEQIDPFVRIESMSTELNYVAVIEINIVETATNNPVWGGSISRIHQVTPGEYMHEDRARPAFRQAFRSVLSSYPALDSDAS